MDKFLWGGSYTGDGGKNLLARKATPKARRRKLGVDVVNPFPAYAVPATPLLEAWRRQQKYGYASARAGRVKKEL